mgnify:CR=1 FL=1
MTVAKPKPQQLLQPVTTAADSALNQSQFLAISCNLRLALALALILVGWKTGTNLLGKCSNRNHVITFDSHLKTALLTYLLHEPLHELLGHISDTKVLFPKSGGTVLVGKWNMKIWYQTSHCHHKMIRKLTFQALALRHLLWLLL